MKLWAPILFFFISTFTSAEWLDLKVSHSQGVNFKSEVSPLLKGLSIGLSSPDIHFPTLRHRMYVGFSVININNTYYSGSIPLGFGAISPSKNLTLHGTFSTFKSGTDLVLSTGYGLRIVLNPETPHPWFLTLNNAALKGSEDLRFRSTNLGLYRWNTFYGFPIITGVNYNVTRGVISFQDGTRDIIEDSFYLPFVGISKSIGGFIVTPKLSWHPSVMILSLELGRNIY
ncbi:MAG: hypothetical protein HQ509_10165 [Candidatus Marinimicrobia bacterium]|nr:hypothetical protein [Candidatus Neomarinimicrobiota bacterium]